MVIVVDLLTKYKDAFKRAEFHAKHQFPHESIGYIHKDGTYRFLRNLSLHAETSALAEFNPQDFKDVVVVIHSHPNGYEYPSYADIKQQKLWGVPWAILPLTKTETKDWVIFPESE